MQLYVNVFGFQIPSYGLMIALGIVVANMIAFVILKRNKSDINDFIILEAYGLLGGFTGAKLLYLIVSYRTIEWEQMRNITYFNQLMQSGFVFYGGLIGGLALVFIAGKVHKIDAMMYLRQFVFLIPFVHGFGRCGCFLAGCCYGIPYEGFGAVVFPENSYALSGVKLFPVQLVEAALLFFTSLLIFCLQEKVHLHYTIELYLVLYAIIRFVLENVRYDDARGYLWRFSTSQWISVAMLMVAGIMVMRKRQQPENCSGK